jgi:lipopolysaccharide export LptBFGC system permease protein LptF
MAIERSCVSPVLLLLSVVTFSHAFLSQNAVPRGTAGARNSWTRHAFANENLDDEMRYRTRYREDSDAAHELQNLQYDDDETLDIVKGDYYYEGDEDSDYEEDDLYIDEEDVEDEPTGNFWINPKQGFDSLPSERRRTSRIEEATGDHPVRRPRPRPSGKSRSKYVTYFLLRLSSCYSVLMLTSFCFCFAE